MYEFKYLIQPARIEPIDAGRGIFKIVNRQDFLGLDWMRGTWEVTADGAVIAEGELPELRAAPNETQIIKLDLEALKDSEGERFLNVRLYRREAVAWAPAGHETAWGPGARSMAYPVRP